MVDKKPIVREVRSPAFEPGHEAPPTLPIQEGRKRATQAQGRQVKPQPQDESKGGIKRQKTFVQERPSAAKKENEGEDSAEERLPLSEGDETQQKPEDEDKEQAGLGDSASSGVSQSGNLRERWAMDGGL